MRADDQYDFPSKNTFDQLYAFKDEPSETRQSINSARKLPIIYGNHDMQTTSQNQINSPRIYSNKYQVYLKAANSAQKNELVIYDYGKQQISNYQSASNSRIERAMKSNPIIGDIGQYKSQFTQHNEQFKDNKLVNVVIGSQRNGSNIREKYVSNQDNSSKLDNSRIQIKNENKLNYIQPTFNDRDLQYVQRNVNEPERYNFGISTPIQSQFESHYSIPGQPITILRPTTLIHQVNPSNSNQFSEVRFEQRDRTPERFHERPAVIQNHQNFQLIRNLPRNISQLSVQTVPKVEYDLIRLQCSNWQTKYNELHLRFMNMSASLSQTNQKEVNQLKQQNFKLKKQLKETQEKVMAGLPALEDRFIDMIDQQRQATIKETLLLVERLKLETKQNKI